MENDNRRKDEQRAPQEDTAPMTGAPGQVLPAKDRGNELNPPGSSVAEEQHSATSLPEHENETLGTP